MNLYAQGYECNNQEERALKASVVPALADWA